MSNRSYYSSTIEDFCKKSPETILGELSANNEFELSLTQKNAWIEQIPILHTQLQNLESGHIVLEYTIPRMGKRCDTIVLFKDSVYVIEFKCGASSYDSADLRQTLDYALDLKNFHEQSHHLRIIPILVSTKANNTEWRLHLADDDIAKTIKTNGSNLHEIIIGSSSSTPPINAKDWEESTYKPTPTIIEAAKVLYSKHSVEDISTNEASKKNLRITSNKIAEIIQAAKLSNSKSICFITGVPGAGKTLAGLNIANGLLNSEDSTVSTFLSGNGPLVEVLQRALAEDKQSQLGGTISEAERETKTFIQNIHKFRDAYLDESKKPVDKVVVFDEAQRAWSKDKASKFMKKKKGIASFNYSEPEFLIRAMDRKDNWCVIVALIGGGQEINDGEAGLIEWFKALDLFQHWNIYVSDYIEKNKSYTQGRELKELLPNKCNIIKDLHLSVNIRSFRSEYVSDFVNKIISNDTKGAFANANKIGDKFPFLLTRDMDCAKHWILKQKRGSERIGIVSCSSAKRLAPYGIQMKLQIEPRHWFLGEEDDIRSSNFLELSASQFDVQGLELDWTIVGWDADLRHDGEQWSHNSFKGRKWQKINKPENQQYLENAYRVLLTRARQGCIIFIPKGNANDITRLNKYYDHTYDYLKSCGIQEIYPDTSPAT